MAPPRKKCNFKSDLQKEFPFMRSTPNLTNIVFCEIYKCEVDIILENNLSNINKHLIFSFVFALFGF